MDKRICLFCLFLMLACLKFSLAESIETPFISKEVAEQVGQRIWMNECRGSLAGLTSWNEGEEFASLGIGHFIWYPTNKTGKFKAKFPELLGFLDQQKV